MLEKRHYLCHLSNTFYVAKMTFANKKKMPPDSVPATD